MTSRLGRLPTAALALAVPVVALVAIAVTLGATSAPSGLAASTRTTSSRNTLTIANFSYEPDRLVVHAGATVRITNTDGTAHTVTARNGAFDTGDIAGGARTTSTITQPGTYRYYCKIHNYMTGTIVVR